MDARAWLGLQPTHNPMRWYLPVVPGISTGGGFLFGGCALGAAISAMEGSTGRPVVWATAQYLSFAHPGSVLDIDVTVAASGRATTQARAIGHVGVTEILTVNAALGERTFPQSGQWAEMPVVPPPAECPRREPRWNTTNSILNRLDQRWADQGSGNGRCSVWSRMPDLLGVSAPALAVLGDYVPLGLGVTIDHEIHSNSLDNTIRVANVVPTEWVLVDIRVDAVAHGFGHGTVHLWAEDGTLMATASQSALIRLWEGEGYRPATPAEGDAS
ncbi:MAG: thioesterase family protein [Acidimicrobiales bacterium]|jgi:acyl-CoA thioesterase|nr:thioesterase family protein [Acidimicrobiales bacterium]